MLPSMVSRHNGRPSRPPAGTGPADQPFVRFGMPVGFLIVEDEAVIAMDLEAMVRDAGGLPLGIAANAADAERLAATLSPDVILMDVRLKGNRDGIAAAHAIRKAHGIPIVFVTGNEDAATVERIRAFNGASPVPKPVRAATLIEAVLDALDGRARGAPPH